jgi:hypothetical protein
MSSERSIVIFILLVKDATAFVMPIEVSYFDRHFLTTFMAFKISDSGTNLSSTKIFITVFPPYFWQERAHVSGLYSLP